mgnify:CR=1 FL=1
MRATCGLPTSPTMQRAERGLAAAALADHGERLVRLRVSSSRRRRRDAVSRPKTPKQLCCRRRSCAQVDDLGDARTKPRFRVSRWGDRGMLLRYVAPGRRARYPARARRSSGSRCRRNRSSGSALPAASVPRRMRTARREAARPVRHAGSGRNHPGDELQRRARSVPNVELGRHSEQAGRCTDRSWRRNTSRTRRPPPPPAPHT